MHTVHQSLRISAAGVTLEADIVVPDPALGVVLFAHGGGSSRHSPRNRYVAGKLRRARVATVLADLLTHRRSGSTPEPAPSASTSACSRGGWRP
jgi:predicted alpha/beta-hydrolase family hydrolase